MNMPGTVKSLDTSSFGDTIQAYANHIRTFEGIVAGVSNTNATVVDSWRGKGRDAFWRDCEQVQRNLKDIADMMNEFRETLAKAHVEYKQADTELSQAFASEGG